LVFAFCLQVNGQAFGQGKITIKADNVYITENKNVIKFVGNVLVLHGAYSMNADLMEVFYYEGQKKIKEIKSYDNVKFFGEDFNAAGDEGIYRPGKEFITIQKNVILNSGASVASGDKFTYNIKTKTTNLISNSKADNDDIDSRVIIIIDEEDIGNFEENKN